MPFRSDAQMRGFAAELVKLGIAGPKAALRWAGREIIYPALPTAVLAVLANEAVRGVDTLRTRFASKVEPIVERRKKRKKRKRAV